MLNVAVAADANEGRTGSGTVSARRCSLKEAEMRDPAAARSRDKKARMAKFSLSSGQHTRAVIVYK